MALKRKTCTHLEAVDRVHTSGKSICEECVQIGSHWVHLRTCQTCGVTLCCESSTHQHAKKHFESTRHPVISSAEPGERWMWCYEDEIYGKY